MSKSIDTLLWKFLGRKSCLLLAEECGSVTLWVFLSLIFRSVVLLLKLERSIPSGFYLAFPLIIQYLSKYFPFLRERFPLLTVRLAEAVMGRLLPKELLIVIPAHFLGSLLGIALFKVVFPLDILFPSSMVLAPILHTAPVTPSGGVMVQVMAVFLYTSCIIILPELIEVNRLNSKLLSILIAPIMFLRCNGFWCHFNPCVIYALWYINKVPGDHSPLNHGIIGSQIAGSVLSGLFCNIFFPDNPTCWLRREVRFKS